MAHAESTRWENLMEQTKAGRAGYARRTWYVHGTREDAEQEALLVLLTVHNTYPEATEDDLRGKALFALANSAKNAMRDWYGAKAHEGELPTGHEDEDGETHVAEQADGRPLQDEELYVAEALRHAAEMVGGLGSRIVHELTVGDRVYGAAVRQAQARSEREGTVRVTAAVLAEVLEVTPAAISQAMTKLERACHRVARA